MGAREAEVGYGKVRSGLDRRQAAIDRQVDAGDVAALIGGEE